MNRSKAKKANEETRQKVEATRKRYKIDVSLATWYRIVSNEYYSHEEVRTVAPCLFETHGFDFDNNFQIIEGFDHFNNWLEYVLKNLQTLENHPFFAIYNVGNYKWTTVCFAKCHNIVVLFKDPGNNRFETEIEENILNVFYKCDMNFVAHASGRGTREVDCGAASLRNLEIMLEGLKRNCVYFVENFQKLQFCPSEEVKNVKKDFQNRLQNYVLDNLFDNVLELAAQESFKLVAKESVDTLLQYFDVGDCTLSYANVLQEEFKKKENDPDYVIDEAKIRTAKSNFFGHGTVKHLLENSSKLSAETPTQNNSAAVSDELYQLPITKEFPAEARKFTELFTWLVNIKDDSKRNQLLRLISERLGLEHEKVKKFFEFQRRRDETAKSGKSKKGEELEKKDDLKDFLSSEQIPASTAAPERGIKDLEQLLAELQLSHTGSAGGTQWAINISDRIAEIRRSLQRVQSAYEQRWRNASAEDVNRWATSKRSSNSQGNKSEAQRNEDIEEALAVMCRAHSLTCGGQQLRDAQLLTALVCLKGRRGTLCQMSTGEGKTAVVSLLAAAEVLLHNRQVDVVTSNEVLAQEGRSARRSFLGLLGISADANSEKHSPAAEEGNDAKGCYAADVVYGSMAAFQFDFLRHGFEGQGTRGQRKFGRVIVDEVDSMLVDNGGHIAKLAAPFPGVDALRYIHINIWQQLVKAEADIAVEAEKKLEQKAKELGKKLEANKLSIQNIGSKKIVNHLQTESANQKSEQVNKSDEETPVENGSLNVPSSKKKKRMEGTSVTEEENTLMNDLQTEYERYKLQVIQEEIDNMKTRIKKTNPTNIPLIPSHLEEYAKSMEDNWIDSAVYARYQCRENEQYVLRTEGKSEDTVVVPVDYSNTGVTLKNTQWSNGLHQFVQLKHNLRVTPENMTSAYISNIGYIGFYGEKVWGLTGTLGSCAERELLACAYSVDYAKIPTYKPKVFEEFPGVVVQDARWANVIAMDAVFHVRKERSVLIICRTILEVNLLESNIKALLHLEKMTDITVKTYPDEDSCSVVNDVVKPKEIIIATNIAGRGTDLRTSPDLEDHGGLHVCVSFLPANQRVEDQAFGRTGRQGNSGTAQLLIAESDVVELGIDLDAISCFNDVKIRRDHLEIKRIERIRNVELEDIHFQDAVFSKFSDMYVNFKNKSETNIELVYLAKDLKELWALWLHKKDFKSKHLKRDRVTSEYEDFLKTAGQILGWKTNDGYCGGRISHNPYYSIWMAEYFVISKNISSAEKSILRAIELGNRNPNILYPAYLKLFEIEIEKGQQLFERFRKAMLQVCGIDLLNFSGFKENESDGVFKRIWKHNANIFKAEKSEEYKEKAKEALSKTKAALEQEIHFMKVNYLGDDSKEGKDSENQHKHSTSTTQVKKVETQNQRALTDSCCNCSKELPSNLDFLNILITRESPLIKQIYSRYIILNTFYQHVISLQKQVEDSCKNKAAGLAVTTRVPNYLKSLLPKKESTPTTSNSATESRNTSTVSALSPNAICSQSGIKPSPSTASLSPSTTESSSKTSDSSASVNIQSFPAKTIPSHVSNSSPSGTDSSPSEAKPSMQEVDLSELGLLGLETLYVLRDVHDVPMQVIRSAQVQIVAGLSSAGAGAFFPPAMFVLGPLATTLIAEGICDIVIELISQGNSEYSASAYIKGKCISYGISLITLGLSSLASCVSILEEAIKCCKSLSSMLRSCNRFKWVCQRMASIIEKLQKYFTKLMHFALMAKVGAVGVVATKSQMFCAIMKSAAMATLKSVVGSVISEKILTKALEETFKTIKPLIESSVRSTLVDHISEVDLQHINAEKLQTLVNDILTGTFDEMASYVIKELAFGVLQHCHLWYIKLPSITVESIISVSEISKYAEDFCQKLKIELGKRSQDTKFEDKSKHSFSNLMDILISSLTEKIYSMIMHVAGKSVNTFVVNPLMEKAWDYFDPKDKSSSEEMEKNFNEIWDACKLLGVDYGASKEDIKKAWKKFTLKNHPDSRSRDKSLSVEESSKLFLRATSARDMLIDFNTSLSASLPMNNIQQEAHRGNMLTLSDEQEQHIVIFNKETGQTIEIGEKYKKDGKNSWYLEYIPPSKDSPGHYVPSAEKYNLDIKQSGDSNCFYDSCSAIAKSQGLNVTAQQLRDIAERTSCSNFIYGALNALSEVFNNNITKQLYIGAQSSLLVGGRDSSRLRHMGDGELYPHEAGPIKDAKTKEIRKGLKNVVLKFMDHLDERFEKFEEYKEKGIRTNLLKSKKYVVPAFGQSNKELFVVAIIYLKLSDGTEMKRLTVSGSEKFHDREKIDISTGKSKDTTNLKFSYKGYEFVDPGFKHGEMPIYDLNNRVQLKDTFNKPCGAQKVFYDVGNTVKSKLAVNPNLKVTTVLMEEYVYKKGLQRHPNLLYRVASCAKCQDVLPKCMGL